MRTVIYKARIEIDDNGTVHVTSYLNRKIPYGVMSSLNEAVHDAVDEVNGKTYGEKLIQFSYDGHTYRQIPRQRDVIGAPCISCCFYKDMEDGTGRLSCHHPYYLGKDGITKGSCHNKPYIEL